MTLTWIIDTYLESRNEYLEHTVLMADAVKQLGYGLIETAYIPHSIETSVELSDPTISAIGYGTIGFIRQLHEKYPNLRPGGFFENSNFSAETCRENYGSLMMNHGTFIDKFSIDQMTELLPDIVEKNGPVFVRPNGVGKAFTGSVIGTDRYPVESFLKYVDAYAERKFDSPDIPRHQEEVHVHRILDIQGEYRVVCGPEKIIAASQYRWQGRLDKRKDVHPKALELAESFVIDSSLIKPDLVYVMDVAIVGDEEIPLIVEFNNFSNSGLYMCDRIDIVREVSNLCEGL